ncbi:hypothetical protein ACIQ9R_36295 [Streptomyces sp. NPDC094447]|uniref:hypothetical protein n=1 Tax=Streptomyces sp. NPDC094447 TaxID=3366062 RepID=UPI0037FFDD54
MDSASWRKALDRLPYKEWLPATAVPEHTGVAPEDVNPLLRRARRAGSLCTSGQGSAMKVMRVRRIV